MKGKRRGEKETDKHKGRNVKKKLSKRNKKRNEENIKTHAQPRPPPPLILHHSRHRHLPIKRLALRFPFCSFHGSVGPITGSAGWTHVVFVAACWG